MATFAHILNHQNQQSTTAHDGNEGLITAGLFLASVFMNFPRSDRRKRSIATDTNAVQATENLFFKVLSDLDQEDCIATAVCEASSFVPSTGKDLRNDVLLNSLGINPIGPVAWNEMNDFKSKYQYAGFVGKSMGSHKECQKTFPKCSLPNDHVLGLLTREINSCEEMLVSFDNLRTPSVVLQSQHFVEDDDSHSSEQDSLSVEFESNEKQLSFVISENNKKAPISNVQNDQQTHIKTSQLTKTIGNKNVDNTSASKMSTSATVNVAITEVPSVALPPSRSHQQLQKTSKRNFKLRDFNDDSLDFSRESFESSQSRRDSNSISLEDYNESFESFSDFLKIL